MTEPDAPALDALLALVGERAGLAFPSARREVAVAGVRRAMEATGVPDAAAFLRLARHDDAALDALLAEVTVGETYFFRDPGQWEVIRARAVPEIRERRGPGHVLRAWSAACATGEEAYTLAIVLHEMELGKRRQIVGTDLSEPRLEAARAARYRGWALRGVPEDTVRSYFTPRGEVWELVPGLRAGVEFRRLNLAEDDYPSASSGIGAMDLVLCRNVLIYLEPDAIARAARRLIESLAPGGWLFPGASDPPLSDFADCDVVVTTAGLAYRRPLLARPHPVPASPSARTSLDPSIDGGSNGDGRIEKMGAVGDPARHRPAAHRSKSIDPRSADPRADSETTDSRRDSRSDQARPSVVPTATDAARRYAARDYAAAAEAARARLAVAPGDAVAWETLVRALANRGALDEARAACDAALELHRGRARLHHLNAVLLAASGRHADAAAAARQAVYLDPDLAVAHVELAAASMRLSNHDTARRALRAAERLLGALPPEKPVPAADGETAGHLLGAVRARLALLPESAA